MPYEYFMGNYDRSSLSNIALSSISRDHDSAILGQGNKTGKYVQCEVVKAVTQDISHILLDLHLQTLKESFSPTDFMVRH
ncbi:hypothetical protein GDO78_009747 [Eleutherodactylus coqui]|uniref:Uncharacterized protein n=1 Tax=Eleutherodactylus coqui TaxID=57060 RepID=A0A8J6FAN2_ELECQ|nr:hypothetical protein GDO78_009747 [Eleutherodactylus coqui]